MRPKVQSIATTRRGSQVVSLRLQFDCILVSKPFDCTATGPENDDDQGRMSAISIFQRFTMQLLKTHLNTLGADISTEHFCSARALRQLWTSANLLTWLLTKAWFTRQKTPLLLLLCSSIETIKGCFRCLYAVHRRNHRPAS